MVMGRLLVGSPPINDAGNVPVAVPTNVPCSEVLLQGPFPADLLRGLCFSNSLASSAEWISIWSFLSNMCSREMFPFPSCREVSITLHQEDTKSVPELRSHRHRRTLLDLFTVLFGGTSLFQGGI